jgi:hypothetical protein
MPIFLRHVAGGSGIAGSVSLKDVAAQNTVRHQEKPEQAWKAEKRAARRTRPLTARAKKAAFAEEAAG